MHSHTHSENRTLPALQKPPQAPFWSPTVPPPPLPWPSPAQITWACLVYSIWRIHAECAVLCFASFGQYCACEIHLCCTYNCRPAIFNLVHLMAHINGLLQFWGTPKNIFFADLTKNRYNFDSFRPYGYCCAGCCHFFIWQGKRGQCPWLKSQVLHVLKILVAH